MAKRRKSNGQIVFGGCLPNMLVAVLGIAFLSWSQTVEYNGHTGNQVVAWWVPLALVGLFVVWIVLMVRNPLPAVLIGLAVGMIILLWANSPYVPLGGPDPCPGSPVNLVIGGECMLGGG